MLRHFAGRAGDVGGEVLKIDSQWFDAVDRKEQFQSGLQPADAPHLAGDFCRRVVVVDDLSLCGVDHDMVRAHQHAQRNLDSSSHRQVLERYLEEFKAPAGVGQPIERAMKAAAPAAEDLREMLVTAEREKWNDTDKLAQIDTAILRLRRALRPVAKAVQAAKPVD